MTQEETKAKCEKLLYEILKLSKRNSAETDIRLAILSTQNTIEILEQVNEKSKVKMGELYIYHEDICDAIEEQQLILNELKSRL